MTYTHSSHYICHVHVWNVVLPDETLLIQLKYYHSTDTSIGRDWFCVNSIWAVWQVSQCQCHSSTRDVNWSTAVTQLMSHCVGSCVLCSVALSGVALVLILSITHASLMLDGSGPAECLCWTWYHASCCWGLLKVFRYFSHKNYQPNTINEAFNAL